MKSKEPSSRPTFEDSLPLIDAEIAKRRHKWNLTSISWMDYDDVSQIIRIHIFRKWHQYQPGRPLAPWLNTIITNQIRNLIRNLYSNFTRPCLKCAAALDGDKCHIYGEQCADCPLFAHWQKRKQPATNIKMPVSMEKHTHEVHAIFDDSIDVSRFADAVHEQMKLVLKPVEWLVYEGLYITHRDEADIAKDLGFVSNETGRNPGYKQMKNIRKTIMAQVRRCLANGDIDIF